MKKIILIIALQFGCISGLLAFQDYDRFYKKHKGEEGVLSFSVPEGLLQAFIEEDEGLDEVLSKVDRVSFLVSDEKAKALIKDLDKELSDREYKDMVQMKDGNSTFKLVGKDDGEGLEEILLTMEDNDSLLVICVKGYFSYEDARELAKSINTDKVREQVK